MLSSLLDYLLFFFSFEQGYLWMLPSLLYFLFFFFRVSLLMDVVILVKLFFFRALLLMEVAILVKSFYICLCRCEGLVQIYLPDSLKSPEQPPTPETACNLREVSFILWNLPVNLKHCCRFVFIISKSYLRVYFFKYHIICFVCHLEMFVYPGGARSSFGSRRVNGL